MTDRYAHMFSRLQAQQEGAFVPFLTLGDPDLATSEALIDTLVSQGADALELGFPFSDPVADGPVIQAANLRAIDSGTRIADCFALLKRVRAKYPELPIGLLVYANLVFSNGLNDFYQRAAATAVDSVLIADVPVREGQPFVDAAREHGIAPIFIAPPDASQDKLTEVARACSGYIYLLSRAGVTGANTEVAAPARELIQTLQEAGGPPPLLGFGISRPEHVQAALAAGAAGVICGSAIVRHIADYQHDQAQLLALIGDFVQRMKAATRAS